VPEPVAEELETEESEAEELEQYEVAEIEEAVVEVPAAAVPSDIVAHGDIYTVVAGDSLYRIARNILGRGARWSEIFELNRDLIANPNLISIGWQLRMPA